MNQRHIIRAIIPHPGGKYHWMDTFGYIMGYAGDDTPLGFIELNQWYWKRDFSYMASWLPQQHKFNWLNQPEFFKITSIN